ncbi:MAG: hypothetical protein MJZ41_11635 [Bacteroidaceae bacterium]|nr:hypothetical protein [Bacteroidaceae bacterium]
MFWLEATTLNCERGTALQAVFLLPAIPGTLYPVTDRLYEAVVPSRHTCELE